MYASTTHQAPFISASESYLVSTTGDLSESSLSLIPPATLSKLKSVGLPRVKDMRTGGVAVQVVSHMPVKAALPSCVKMNDALHAAVCFSPERFAAVALLPVTDGAEAARELKRCVARYDFVGGVLGLADDTPFADEGFEELWATAAKYSVPVVLKEAWPCLEQIRRYRNVFPNEVLGPLVTNFYAAHTASPYPVLQLYAAGVFDRHPTLRLVTSRAGITISSLLPRIQSMFASLPDTQKPARSFLDVWQRNLYVSTEDVLDISSMRALLEHTPLNRVLYGANYPFEDRGKAIMAELRDSGVLRREEWDKIASKNAEALFGLRKPVRGERSSAGRSSY